MNRIGHQRLLTLTQFHNFSEQWPKGTYTLVKSRAGCPSGWKEGWRYQDNEDNSNNNFITPDHHFYGIIFKIKN